MTSHFLLAMPFSKTQDAQPALAPTPASRSTPIWRDRHRNTMNSLHHRNKHHNHAFHNTKGKSMSLPHQPQPDLAVRYTDREPGPRPNSRR